MAAVLLPEGLSELIEPLLPVRPKRRSKRHLICDAGGMPLAIKVGDRGYDASAIRCGLRSRGIVPLVAMRRTAHGSGLGRWRSVVEANVCLA